MSRLFHPSAAVVALGVLGFGLQMALHAGVAGLAWHGAGRPPLPFLEPHPGPCDCDAPPGR